MPFSPDLPHFRTRALRAGAMFSSLYCWPPGSLACSGHSAGPVKQMNEEDTEKQLCFVSLTGMFAQSQSVAMGS